ncbi:MAG: LemA family protein [Aminobacterium sp.]|jgi:LemA protein|uniref:LemA family protein n=1 Tax=unclassified Aminobacterium TaxID=2685012 RepID=UPI001BD19A2C|nr:MULTISPECIES: LemA family protein [unclassified Aminobacterium]MDD2207468.1 LemA family protein [Aminobacterium sp.]MDD3426411.1 LemA family protein [Aminobacterium sp.]MDD3708412.1 LemA family protein [Aminobacterium sp.]MDD4229191.1 LemA family protein [Aminobacterium sp.]MDD4552210.1 LemA family protein [Aminobacterium sp.]
MPIFIILAVIAALIFWAISIYNHLVRMVNLKDEAWSGIDVQLKRRFDLIPNLVETVKGYAAHEKEVFQRVTEARSAITKAHSLQERADSENMLSGALKSLFAVAENYPALQANSNFLQLQEELSSLENDIQMSRRYYNGAARDFNIAISTFPAVLIARNFGYEKADYFEATEEARTTPHVSF